MTIPKRPSTLPPSRNVPSSTPSRHPSGNAPPGSVQPGRYTRPPSNMRDAIAEAHAISGGAFVRSSSAPASQGTAVRKAVLLVDDDASMRARLRAGLEGFYDVHEARDGMEAVEMLGKIPNLAMIVTEVTLPRLDGFGLAKIARSSVAATGPRGKKVPVMFVSNRNTTQDVTQALVIGACQFVPKTTSTADIVAKIRKIVV